MKDACDRKRLVYGGRETRSDSSIRGNDESSRRRCVVVSVFLELTYYIHISFLCASSKPLSPPLLQFLDLVSRFESAVSKYKY